MPSISPAIFMSDYEKEQYENDRLRDLYNSDNMINVTKNPFNAKGIGTDDTTAIQLAIDTCSADGGGIVYIPRTTLGYKATKIGLKKGVSIKSNGATLTPLDSSEPSFMYIADTTYQITSVNFTGFTLATNPNNTSQNGLDLTAIHQSIPGYTGGIWYSELKDVVIQNFSGVGLKLYCNDNDGTGAQIGVDMANQFLRFTNVRVFRNSATAKCLEITGQLGQAKFDTCEFDGVLDSNGKPTLGGISVDLISLPTNDDKLLAPIIFDNCTFQKSSMAVQAYNADQIIFRDCYFENLQKSITLKTASKAKVYDCHFANACSDGNNGGYGIYLDSTSSCIERDNNQTGLVDLWIKSSGTSNSKSVNSESSVSKILQTGLPTVITGMTYNVVSAVTNATITSGGSGYTSPPDVSFSGGGGVSAAATAILTDGAVVGIQITNPGSGYTSAPAISFSGGGGISASATAIYSNAIVAYSGKVCFTSLTATGTTVILNTILGQHGEGEILTLRVWGSGDSTRILRVNGVTGIGSTAGNIVLPNGVTNIDLKQNDTILLQKTTPSGLISHWVVLAHQGVES